MAEAARADKLSVTVPANLASEVRERVGKGNVSAYVTDALIRQLEHDRLGDLVAELDAIHEPLTEQELAAAKAEWPHA